MQTVSVRERTIVRVVMFAVLLATLWALGLRWPSWSIDVK